MAALGRPLQLFQELVNSSDVRELGACSIRIDETNLILAAEGFQLAFTWEAVNSISVAETAGFCDLPCIRLNVDIGPGADVPGDVNDDGDGDDGDEDKQSRVFWLRLPGGAADPQQQLALLNQIEQGLGEALRKSFPTPQQQPMASSQLGGLKQPDENVMEDDDEGDGEVDGDEEDANLFQPAMFWEPGPTNDPEWESRLADIWDSKLVPNNHTSADCGDDQATGDRSAASQAWLTGLISAGAPGSEDGFDDLPPL